MEPPRKKAKGDGRKTLGDFKKKKPIRPPDQRLRVWIVSKRQPDGREEPLQPEAEGSDDVNNSEGNWPLFGIYMSRQSRGEDFSTSGDHSVEEIINVDSELLSHRSRLFDEVSFRLVPRYVVQFTKPPTALLKLFSDMEILSPEEPPIIQIEASEESALVGLLEYINFSSMPQSYEETVDLLMTSDEFEVLSCAEECIDRLVCNLNSAFSSFELSHKVHWATVRESLAKRAMDYVTQTNLNRMSSAEAKGDCNINRIEDELLHIPSSAIKAVFRMDKLNVETEDAVYDFIMYWAQINYPKPEDHCRAKELHLERLIHFTYLTNQKLEVALQCDFFYPEAISKAVTEALAFKVREPYCRGLASRCRSSKQRLERRYKRTPIMVTRLRSPGFDRCQVYFSLTEEELLGMFYWEGIRESEDFQFGHQLFSLVASWNEVENETCFGLIITAKEEILDDAVYATRFLAMREADDGPELFETGRGTLIPGNQVNVGTSRLIPEFWSGLVNSTCLYIIGGLLHLCVEITCKR